METLEIIKKPKTKHKNTDENLTEFSVFNLCAETAMAVFSSFMMYFLIMRAQGLHEVFALRYLNAILLTLGILYALNAYKKHTGAMFNYKKGLEIGMLVTLIAVVPFAIFIYLYLNIDDGFLGFVAKNVELRDFISPGTVACFICLEGFCSGSIMSFILMQFFKSKRKQ